MDALGDLFERLSGEVPTTKVLRITRFDYSGHVYNLQTTSNYYSASGIIVHNCAPGRVDRKPKFVEACRPYAANVARELQPKRIICLGGTALLSVVGRNPGVLSIRKGWAWHRTDAGLVPVFFSMNPAAATRNRFMREAFEEDLKWSLFSETPTPKFDAMTYVVEDEEDAREAEEDLRSYEWSAYDVETHGQMHDRDFRVECVTFAPVGRKHAWTFGREALRDSDIRAVVKRLVETLNLVTANGKYDDRSMLLDFGAFAKESYADVRLISRMLDPGAGAAVGVIAERVGLGGHKRDMKEHTKLVAAELSRQAKPKSALTPKGNPRKVKPNLFDVPAEVLAKIAAGADPKSYMYGYTDATKTYVYNAIDCHATREYAVKVLPEFLTRPEVSRIWNDVVRGANSAVRMIEHWGFQVDRAAIDQFAAFCKERIIEARSTLDAIAGSDFNPNSPVQVGALLFDKLRLPKVKQTDTGADSTDHEVLEELSGEHEAVDALIKHRKWSKLDGTYATGMLPHVREDGRVHGSYLLDGTGTGRLSCLAGSTRVRTRRGDVPLEQVSVGDFVWTHKLRWRPVTAFLRQGVKSTRASYLSTGHVLISTADHRVLTMSGQWRQIGELHECFQAVDERPAQPRGGRGGVQGHGGGADVGADSVAARNDAPHDIGGAARGPARGGAQGARSLSLLGVEDRRQEPYARKDGQATSQLERRMRGRQGLPDDPQGRATASTSPSGDGRSPWTPQAPVEVGGTPHRREPEEQFDRQPGARNARWAHGDSLLAGEGLQPVTIEKVDHRGDREVFDITVAEDHSFLAEGVFVHNCQEPNMQNLPRAKGSVDAKMSRNCFVAPKGYVILESDFSQLELRVAALLSGDEVMIEDFKRGIDLHMNMTSELHEIVWGITREQWDALPREGKGEQRGKDYYRSIVKNAFVFGGFYGKTTNTLCRELHCAPKVVETIFRKIWGRYPKLAAWREEQKRYAQKHGGCWTYWNGERARWRPLWGIADPDDGARVHALNGAINTPCQGTGADYMTASLWPTCQWIAEEKFPAKLVGTVHDSLLLEVRRDLVDEAAGKVKSIMQSHYSGDVPLDVDQAYGEAWGSLSEKVKTPGTKREERAMEGGVV